MMARARLLAVTAMVVVSVGASAQSGQGSAGSAGPTPPPAQLELRPESLARIRKGIDRPANKLLPDERLRFYALVIAKEPSVKEILGNYDLRYGPTRGGNPMSHQEFLNMVTPRELYGSGGIQAYELLQFSLINWAGQAIIKKGIDALQKARSEREVQEIRDRIDRELAALKRRGGG